MAKTGLTFKVSIVGVRETLAKFKELPKEANNDLRKRSQELAGKLAESARAAARRTGHQAALVAPTVKARRDRVPSVQAGGSTRVGRYGVPAYAVLFGSEFGMDRHTGWYRKSRYDESIGFQYHPHTGTVGLWFFPTVEREAPAIADAWDQVAADIITRFGE